MYFFGPVANSAGLTENPPRGSNVRKMRSAAVVIALLSADSGRAVELLNNRSFENTNHLGQWTIGLVGTNTSHPGLIEAQMYANRFHAPGPSPASVEVPPNGPWGLELLQNNETSFKESYAYQAETGMEAGMYMINASVWARAYDNTGGSSRVRFRVEIDDAGQGFSSLNTTTNVTPGWTDWTQLTFNTATPVSVTSKLAVYIEMRANGITTTPPDNPSSWGQVVADNASLDATLQNNSVITTSTNSLAFGRLMQGQTPTLGFNVVKSGSTSNSTTYTATPNIAGISVSPGSGSMAFGAQSALNTVQLLNAPLGSGSTGAKSYNVTVDNTATTAFGGGGSDDANDSVTVSATVVANRTISASAVNLGNVIVGATSSSQVSALTTTGDDNHFTRVTVNGTSANDGSVTVAAGSSQLFNEASDTVNRNVSGVFATAGAKSGSVPLSTTGEGLTGEGVNSVAVAYTANVYDPSAARFSSNNGATLSFDLGTFAAGSGQHTANDAIYNLLQTTGFTATLDFDTISGTGDTAALYTNLTNGAFSGLAAGVANAYGFTMTFDANNLPGTYNATYELRFSDADTFAGASGPASQLLTLNLTGTISGEPVFDGDYNNDMVVDVADYVVWRQHFANGTALPHNETVGLGTTDTDDFNVWRANFGDVEMPGSGSAAEFSSAAVPEPATWGLLLLALLAECAGPVRHRRSGRRGENRHESIVWDAMAR
jgi:hypothetical protein